MSKQSNIKTPVVVKLKPGWRLKPDGRVFTSTQGTKFSPGSSLPKKTKIVYMVPKLAKAKQAQLSKDEMDLARYVHVILPAGEPPSKYLKLILSWPCVEQAYVAPNISLAAY